MKIDRLPGHSLHAEGRAYEQGYRRAVGKAHCSCGAWSPVLPNDSSRKQWHRDHKAAIRASVAAL